ncbi:hypothetical protein J6590_096793 [Homalodisca vitripennis]|nr:hypothetical protein J6590_096793 [Homalodisca vitripennis]
MPNNTKNFDIEFVLLQYNIESAAQCVTRYGVPMIHPSSEFKWVGSRKLGIERRIDQLTAEREHILDHSIQSDAHSWRPYSWLLLQCDLSSSTACEDPRCSEIRDLVASLKTTVEELEAELECFKAEVVKKSKTHQSDSENKGWVVVQYKSKKNSKNVKGSDIKKLLFPAVYVEGDRHVRHLIGLVRQRVSPSTRVGGTCRPGAKLLTVTDSSLPPPGSCYVLFAGTNDVAADESYTIFEHLERQLTARLSSSARIALVNFYIEELSVRYRGIEVLNFDEIRRPNTVYACDCLASGCWLSFCWGVLIVSISHQPSGPNLACSCCLFLCSPFHSVVFTACSRSPTSELGGTISNGSAVYGAGHRWVHYIETSSSAKTPGPASSRLALVPPPAGAMTRPGNKTFAEAVTSSFPATSSPVLSIIIHSVF